MHLYSWAICYNPAYVVEILTVRYEYWLAYVKESISHSYYTKKNKKFRESVPISNSKTNDLSYSRYPSDVTFDTTRRQKDDAMTTKHAESKQQVEEQGSSCGDRSFAGGPGGRETGTGEWGKEELGVKQSKVWMRERKYLQFIFRNRLLEEHLKPTWCCRCLWATAMAYD